MTEYRVTRSGVTFGGRVYSMGSTFTLDDEKVGSSNQQKRLYERLRSGEISGIEKVEAEAAKETKATAETEAPKRPGRPKKEEATVEVKTTEPVNEATSGAESKETEKEPAKTDEKNEDEKETS